MVEGKDKVTKNNIRLYGEFYEYHKEKPANWDQLDVFLNEKGEKVSKEYLEKVFEKIKFSADDILEVTIIWTTLEDKCEKDSLFDWDQCLADLLNEIIRKRLFENKYEFYLELAKWSEKKENIEKYKIKKI
jgi:hypothetical protein